MKSSNHNDVLHNLLLIRDYLLEHAQKEFNEQQDKYRIYFCNKIIILLYRLIDHMICGTCYRCSAEQKKEIIAGRKF